MKKLIKFYETDNEKQENKYMEELDEELQEGRLLITKMLNEMTVLKKKYNLP